MKIDSTENRLILRNNISKVYNEYIKVLGDNVFRGHTPSLSSVIENEICYYIKRILGDDYFYYIDPTFSKTSRYFRKSIRPDIVVTDKSHNIKFVIEVKSSAGWVRNLQEDKKYYNKLISNKNKFTTNRKILCKYFVEKEGTRYNVDNLQVELVASEQVKYIYVVLTSNSNSIDNALINNKKLRGKGIYSFVLFSGWYNELKEIDNDEIISAHMTIDDFDKIFE